MGVIFEVIKHFLLLHKMLDIFYWLNGNVAPISYYNQQQQQQQKSSFIRFN